MQLIVTDISEVCIESSNSPYGHTLIVTCAQGLCGLLFPKKETAIDALLKEYWPKASRIRNNPFPISVESLFSNTEPNIPLVIKGTPFRQSVWQALLNIPCGKTATYSDIAAMIGKPNAVRAVGSAVGANPVTWLIPCHRVLRKDGALGGYRWGLEIKQKMLAYERAFSGR